MIIEGLEYTLSFKDASEVYALRPPEKAPRFKRTINIRMVTRSLARGLCFD